MKHRIYIGIVWVLLLAVGCSHQVEEHGAEEIGDLNIEEQRVDTHTFIASGITINGELIDTNISVGTYSSVMNLPNVEIRLSEEQQQELEEQEGGPFNMKRTAIPGDISMILQGNIPTVGAETYYRVGYDAHYVCSSPLMGRFYISRNQHVLLVSFYQSEEDADHGMNMLEDLATVLRSIEVEGTPIASDTTISTFDRVLEGFPAAREEYRNEQEAMCNT